MSIALIVRRLESMHSTYMRMRDFYLGNDATAKYVDECCAALQEVDNLRLRVSGKQTGWDILSDADKDAYSRTAALRQDGRPMKCSACGEGFVSEAGYRGHFVLADNRHFSSGWCPWAGFPWPTYYIDGE